MNCYCGIDWAEGHHDIAIIDSGGKLVAKKRISDDPARFAALTWVLADANDSLANPVPVAIETPRGLLVAARRVEAHAVRGVRPRASPAGPHGTEQ